MKNNEKENLAGQLGQEFGTGLRQVSGYEKTQQELRRLGITDHTLNQTPPVGLNLDLLVKDLPSFSLLRQEFEGKILKASVFGLAIPAGAKDVLKFVQEDLGAIPEATTIVEIDRAMIDAVNELKLPNVINLHADARDTQLPSASQDINIRDHLGNCCPPEIDRQIDREVSRVLKPNAIAVVNITTSELLDQSPNRRIIRFSELSQMLPENILLALRRSIYDLSQLKREFGEELEILRSHILEIDPNGSFVIFAEDPDGHGEWYRSFEDHKKLWKEDGFEIEDMVEREGDDSHVPPLRCLRHHVILRKVGK